MTARTVAVASREGRIVAVRRQFPATFRLVRVAPIGIAGSAAVLMIWRSGLDVDRAELLLAAAIAIAISPTFADRASVTLAASPTSPIRRAAARLVVMVPAAIACWLVARAIALNTTLMSANSSWLTIAIPSREAWLILATLLALVLGIESSAMGSGSIPGFAGSSAVVTVLTVALFLPETIAVIPVQQHQLRWAGALVLALAVLLVTRRDPGIQRRNSSAEPSRPIPPAPEADRPRPTINSRSSRS